MDDNDRRTNCGLSSGHKFHVNVKSRIIVVGNNDRAWTITIVVRIVATISTVPIIRAQISRQREIEDAIMVVDDGQ